MAKHIRDELSPPLLDRFLERTLAPTAGVFKNGSRRRKEADFGAKNISAFATRLRLRFATTRSRRSQRRRRKSAASARRRSASLPRQLRLLRRFLNSPWLLGPGCVQAWGGDGLVPASCQ